MWLWRSRVVAFSSRPHRLAAGALLATPTSTCTTWLCWPSRSPSCCSSRLARGFTASNIAGLACAGALMLIYPYVTTQVGLAAALIVLALVAQRALVEGRRAAKFEPSLPGAGASPRVRNP